MDNCSTHKTVALKNWLARHPRFHVHFRIEASWLNQVERQFANPTDRCCVRREHTRAAVDSQSIYTWAHNNTLQPKPFVWTHLADHILYKYQADFA